MRAVDSGAGASPDTVSTTSSAADPARGGQMSRLTVCSPWATAFLATRMASTSVVPANDPTSLMSSAAAGRPVDSGDDESLDAYNQMLAQLAERDRKG